jgi:flavin-dependent dehydrogenase
MNRIRPQVDVKRLGFMGPYSMFGVYVDLDDDRVDVTVGLLHDSIYPPARELLEAYVESHHWVGELISGGGGLIPTRRPLDSFVADGFACVGDAACMAMPQHASGVCSALIGGKILGETAAGALESGDTSREALWLYNERYMEARGATQANSDLFRRFLLSLSTDEMSLLFAKGLVTEEGIRGSLEGMALELPKSAVLLSSLGLLTRPSLLHRLMRLSRDSLRVLEIYSSYPASDEIQYLPKWRAETQKIFNKWKPKNAG